MTHTKEPWAFNGARIESRDEHGWANDGWIVAMNEGPEAIDNARRIVAAVNACAGLPTEALEREIAEEHGFVRAFQRERDQLAAEIGLLIAERNSCQEVSESLRIDNATLRAALRIQAEEAAKLMAQRDELLRVLKLLIDSADDVTDAELKDALGSDNQEIADQANAFLVARAAITNATHIADAGKMVSPTKGEA